MPVPPTVKFVAVKMLDPTSMSWKATIQLQNLRIGHALPHGRETEVLLAVAERCPSLATISLWTEHQDLVHFGSKISFQSLAAVHKRLPKLQYELGEWCLSDPPYDSMDEVFGTMADFKGLAAPGPAIPEADGVQRLVEHPQAPVELAEEQGALGGRCSE